MGAELRLARLSIRARRSTLQYSIFGGESNAEMSPQSCCHKTAFIHPCIRACKHKSTEEEEEVATIINFCVSFAQVLRANLRARQTQKRLSLLSSKKPPALRNSSCADK